MGCGDSQNQLKKPGGNKNSAYARFDSMDVVCGVKDPKPVIVQEQANEVHINHVACGVGDPKPVIVQEQKAVNEHLEDSGAMVLDKTKQYERCDFVQLERSSLKIDITDSAQTIQKKEPAPQIDPAPHLEKASQVLLEKARQVDSNSTIPIPMVLPCPKSSTSKSGEFVNAHEELIRSEKDSHRKDEQIRKLLAENKRLKEKATKQKASTRGGYLPAQGPKLLRASTMQDKIKAIKMNTELSIKRAGSVGSLGKSKRTQTSKRFSERPSTARPANAKHFAPVSEEEPLSFRFSIKEAKVKRAATQMGKELEKPQITDWEYSEIMFL